MLRAEFLPELMNLMIGIDVSKSPFSVSSTRTENAPLTEGTQCIKNYSFCSSASNWIGMNSPIFIRHATEPLSLAPRTGGTRHRGSEQRGREAVSPLAVLNLDENVDHKSDLDIAFKDNFRARKTSRESISLKIRSRPTKPSVRYWICSWKSRACRRGEVLGFMVHHPARQPTGY